MSGRETLPRAVDIIVPVYNEEACVDEFVERVTAVGLREALIFVDNASTDLTVQRIEQHADVRLVRHDRNAGYGASVRDGIARSGAAAIVIIDADLEYPPESIPDLLTALGRHSVVYGSRFLGDGQPDMSWVRRCGNGLISVVFNTLFRQATTDLYTGMKALRRDALDSLTLRRDGFEHVAEMGVQLAQAGHRIYEIPVRYAPRATGVSKMRHLRETVNYVWYIVTAWLWYRVARRT
jgi:glycosyltransferase involved in cell wall biosynthesis